MEPEAFRIKQEEFRKFERFCLEYDIAIDEEDYLHGWEKNIGQWPLKEQLTSNKPNKEINMIYDFNFLDDKVGELCTKLDINPTSDWDEKHAMKRLIMAKRARAVLQEKNSTEALDSLDYLALYLLKHIPELETYGLLDKETWSEKTFKFLLHIMYLNEISSCYRGFVSIGYSDQCLHLIKETLGEYETPYELIALYNKGQGYFHSNSNFEKAYFEFRKIYPFSEEQKDSPNKKQEDPFNRYFNKDNKNPFKFIVNEKQSINDKLLFQRIACIPAKMMMGECLLKLQRSEEAKSIIEKNNENGHLSDYQKCWKLILQIRSKIDQDDFDDIIKDVENYLKQLENLTNMFSTNGVPRPNLENQLKSLKVEYNQRKIISILEEIFKSGMSEVREENKPRKKTIEDAFILLELQNSDLLDMLMEQINNGNRDELTQTIYLWVKSLSVASKYIESKYNDLTHEKFSYNKNQLKIELTEICDREIFHEKTCEVLQDNEFRPNQGEIRKDYLDGLHDLQNAFVKISVKISKEISNTINNKNPNEESVTNLRNLQSDIACVLKDLWQKEMKAIDSILSYNEKRNELSKWLLEQYNQRKKLLNNELLYPGVALQVRSFLANKIFSSVKACKIKGLKCFTYKCWECNGFKKRINDNPECNCKGKDIMHYYDNKTYENFKELRKRLHIRKTTPFDKGIGLAVLRRWNSYTPALAKSEGGGYFLYLAKENEVEFGIVIDPGYDFLKNFFAEGFGINDIHAILVSHDHPDHLDDFSSIINLKVEAMKNRGNEEKKEPQNKIIAVLSEGSYEKLRTDIMLSHSVFKDTRVVSADMNNEISMVVGQGERFLVKAIKALHPSISIYDSIGFIITYKNDNKNEIAIENEIKIGFTGDTKWYEDITDEFKDCQVVCYHAGAIIDEEISLYKCFNEDEFNKFITRTKHLYLPGTLMFSKFFKDKKDQLGIISEFGEELKGGLRVDFVNRLAEYIGSKEGRNKRAPIIPSDTGLMVKVDTREIMCTCCKKFYRYDFIEFESFGPNERLFSICSNCKKMLSENQRQHIYRKKVMEAYTHEAELYI